MEGKGEKTINYTRGNFLDKKKGLGFATSRSCLRRKKNCISPYAQEKSHFLIKLYKW